MNPATIDNLGLTARRYQQQRAAHWDRVAEAFPADTPSGQFYHRELVHYYRLLIPPGLRVLELGCGQGDLLAALQPAVGVGVDFSATMLKQAAERHPQLRFLHADAHEVALHEPFDVIVLSDLVNDLWDVQVVFERLARLAGPQTRLVLNMYSRVWQAPLSVAQLMGRRKPTLDQNWLTQEDLANLLRLTGFEVVKQSRETLLPAYIPLLSAVANRGLVKLWPFSWFALTNFLVARPAAHPSRTENSKAPVVSVVVPARNEAGNIEGIWPGPPTWAEAPNSCSWKAIPKMIPMRRSSGPWRLTPNDSARY